MSTQSTETPMIVDALRFLAGHCDGARTLDGHGFNKMDADFGHDLAERFEHDREMSIRQQVAAHQMLRKYRRQLAAAGIDFDELRPGAHGDRDHPEATHYEPPSEPPGVGVEAAPAAAAVPNHRQIAVEGNEIVIRFGGGGESPESFAELVSIVKKIPGRRWDGAANRVPLESVEHVRWLADEYGFEMTGEVIAPPAAPPARSTPGPLPVRTVDVETDSYFGNGRCFVIRFPYDETLVELMRTVPDRHWDKARRVNVVPLTRVLEVEEFATRYGFEILPGAQEVMDAQREAARAEAERIEALIADSKALDTDRPLELEGLRRYQHAGCRYLLDHGNSLVGDDMGGGKTIEILAAAEQRHRDFQAGLAPTDGYPLLIACKKRLIRDPWLKEIRKWHAKWGIERRTEIITSTSDFGLFGTPDIGLINFEILHKRADVLCSGWQAMAIDEVHHCKNPRAIRTQFARFASQQLPADALILNTTGSLIVNVPQDAIEPLKITRLIDHPVFGGEREYKQRFCKNGSTPKSRNDLHVALRIAGYLRRTKKEMLPELGERQILPVTVPLSNEDEYREAERRFLEWLRETEGDEAAARAARAEMLVRMNKLRALCGQGKLESTVEWVEGKLDEGAKLVVFAHHKPIQAMLYERFSAYNPRQIIAGVEPEQAIADFQEDETVRIMVASDVVGGEGITLTASSDAILVELPWTPKDVNQPVDRCHRKDDVAVARGLQPVTGWLITAEGTIDELLGEILARKAQIAGDIQDGTASMDEEESVMIELVNALKVRHAAA